MEPTGALLAGLTQNRPAPGETGLSHHRDWRVVSLPATGGQFFLQGLERLQLAGCGQFSLLRPGARISHSEIGLLQYLPQPIHAGFGQLGERRYILV